MTVSSCFNALEPTCLVSSRVHRPLKLISPAKAIPVPRATRSFRQQQAVIKVQARRRKDDDDDVIFDGEELWDDQDAGPSSALAGPILTQLFRAVGVVVYRLTEVALTFAPEDASPSAVRAAVSGGLVLLALSFVKGILSLILTIGTVVFGAFVTVRVFGLDVGRASTAVGQGRSSGKRQGKSGKRPLAPSKRALPEGSSGGGLSGILSIFSDGDSDDDGLADVWFDRKVKKKKSPKAGGQTKRQ